MAALGAVAGGATAFGGASTGSGAAFSTPAAICPASQEPSAQATFIGWPGLKRTCVLGSTKGKACGFTTHFPFASMTVNVFTDQLMVSTSNAVSHWRYAVSDQSIRNASARFRANVSAAV